MIKKPRKQTKHHQTGTEPPPKRTDKKSRRDSASQFHPWTCSDWWAKLQPLANFPSKWSRPQKSYIQPLTLRQRAPWTYLEAEKGLAKFVEAFVNFQEFTANVTGCAPHARANGLCPFIVAPVHDFKVSPLTFLHMVLNNAREIGFRAA